MLLAIGSALLAPRIHAKDSMSEDAAALRLQAYLAKTLPARGLSLNCIALLFEESTAQFFQIAVREKHGGTCPGDPDTAPIVDRYRILRKGSALQRYDVIQDEWVRAPQPKP